MFAFIALPTFVQNAVASQHSTPMMEEIIVRGVRINNSYWVTICVGSDCRSFLGLSNALGFANEFAEFGEDGGGIELVVKGYRSKDKDVNCLNVDDVRKSNAQRSVGARLIWVPKGTVVMIIYSNKQTELFKRVTLSGSFQLESIPGSCG